MVDFGKNGEIAKLVGFGENGEIANLVDFGEHAKLVDFGVHGDFPDWLALVKLDGLDDTERKGTE